MPGTGTTYAVGTATTRSDGTYALKWNPAATYQYWAVFEGKTIHLGAEAGPTKVTVTVRVDVAVNRKIVKGGSEFVIGTLVTPATRGRPIYLRRYLGGKWKTVATKKQSATKPTFAPGDGLRSGGKSTTVKVSVYRG